MRKRPVSIAILLLVLGFVLLYYTMQKQYMEFQNTCNQKMEELRNTALLWESNGLLEDSFVSGTFCAESGTAQLYIEVSPVEKSEELQVVLTCQGKAFPLTRTGSRFMGELEVPADTVCRISQVTVTSGQAVQTASLGWVINTKDMIFPQVESTYYGKGKSVPAGEPATFSGTIECTVSWPGILREEIVDAELIKRVNGQACDSHSLRVRDMEEGSVLKGRFTATPTEEEPVTYLVHITLASGLELYHTALDLPPTWRGALHVQPENRGIQQNRRSVGHDVRHGATLLTLPWPIWPRQGFCQGVMIERRIRIPLQKGARYGMIQKPTKKQKGEREN